MERSTYGTYALGWLSLERDPFALVAAGATPAAGGSRIIEKDERRGLAGGHADRPASTDQLL